MSCVRLTFPMPPNIANARMHWRARHRAKSAYWDRLDVLMAFGGMGERKRIIETPRMSRATIRSVMYLYSPMDDDNAMARHKWILDWLTTRGFIADDRKSNLRWASLPEQRIDRKNPRIEITLEAA